MRVLLDTHTFLWWVVDNPQLPKSARKIIADGKNEVFLSAASCWEVVIKAQLGKIELPGKADLFISNEMAKNAFQGLPIQTSHALNVYNLPNLHRDPFDRIIVSQAQLEGMPIVTSDPFISQYKVRVLWENK
jgi:PIN domain nuclease of toxin-antitoxin system